MSDLPARSGSESPPLSTLEGSRSCEVPEAPGGGSEEGFSSGFTGLCDMCRAESSSGFPSGLTGLCDPRRAGSLIVSFGVLFSPDSRGLWNKTAFVSRTIPTLQV